MPFCCGASPVKDDEALIVDVHQVLCDKAWDIFKASQSPLRRMCLKKKNFTIEVPENYFVLEQIEQRIEPRNSRLHVIAPGGAHDAEDGNSNNKNSTAAKDSSLLAGKISGKRNLANPEFVSLDTQFSNDTAAAQTYKFRFEKQRRSTVNVSFQRGFTIGGKAKFSVGLPLAGGEASLQYQVSKTEGETFEESLLMEATSDISVGPHSKYLAQIQLEEKKVLADFKVVMRMSMPQGRAPVYIRRKSDEELVNVYSVQNLKDVFLHGAVPCAQEVKKEDGSGRAAVDKIDLVVEGVVSGSVACNHRIQLTSDETLQTKEEARTKYLQGQQGLTDSGTS
ncbi:uncharacterized protein LOC101858001 [Aplysia californica]|uniref:Uncharacterized protein LOC101858001 n=1 Tax=Aplysia californica TaxID=6500 RepID=A0ABM0KAX2_APLCA|nr:uncharacterized protein LOC101858001 [Aplysia californica]